MAGTVEYYVRYQDEKGNPYIEENFDRRSPEIKRLLIDGKGNCKIEPFISWANYKNIYSLSDLHAAMPENEILVIQIEKENLDKVQPTNVFSYRDPQKETTKYGIGNKEFLVNYDFSFNGLPREIQRAFTPAVLLKQPNSKYYKLGEVTTITDAIDERRHYIKEGFGELSDLYFKITDPNVVEQFSEDVLEVTKMTPESWMVTRIPDYMKETPNK